MASDKEVEIPVEVIKTVDPNVLAEFPEGTRVLSITPHGASLPRWSRTARVRTEKMGDQKDYFIKVCANARGKGMTFGEFVSTTAIKSVVPNLCPDPIAFGTYATNPDFHFYLCSFHDMTEDLPNVETFPPMLAELHKNGTSENGKFGFPVTTYFSSIALAHEWADTWEKYFSNSTRSLLQLEQDTQGNNVEIQKLTEPFFRNVIPRLLRPLETGGRSIKPCLVHGDLWHGNADMDGETGLPIVFDASSFYAHNEYDLGVWRESWNNIGENFIRKYHETFPISPPERDHDDRNALYSIRVNILSSILYKGFNGYRERFISEMKYLVDKFPGGLDDWNKGEFNSG